MPGNTPRLLRHKELTLRSLFSGPTAGAFRSRHLTVHLGSKHIGLVVPLIHMNAQHEPFVMIHYGCTHLFHTAWPHFVHITRAAHPHFYLYTLLTPHFIYTLHAAHPHFFFFFYTSPFFLYTSLLHIAYPHFFNTHLLHAAHPHFFLYTLLTPTFINIAHPQFFYTHYILLTPNFFLHITHCLPPIFWRTNVFFFFLKILFRFEVSPDFF